MADIRSKRFKGIIFFSAVLLLCLFFQACTNDDNVATSSSGPSQYFMGLSAIYGGEDLRADGTSQATIMVEVWNASGAFVDAVPVTLSASLGTLAATSLTTVNGVATTTFTAGTTAGSAAINATVENANASVLIPLTSF